MRRKTCYPKGMIYDLIAPCPVRPDIDCIAGAVAYAEYCTRTGGLSAAPWLCGVPDGAAQFYIDMFPEVEWATEALALAASSYALIDFSTPVPLPPEVDHAKVKVVIDHRFLHDPSADFPNAEIQLAAVGAAATLVAERFMAAALTPTRPAAAMLHGAIHSNTLAFTSPLTTDRDRAAFDWLATFLPDADALIIAYQAAHKAAILSALPETLRAETKQYELPDGPYLFSQIELQDALDVWRSAQDTIKAALNALGPRTILNMVDTARGQSITFATDPAFIARLTVRYGKQLQADGALHLTPPQLRKQIAAVLQV
jgi:manganese-dependent inorganic pyrophosphatase